MATGHIISERAAMYIEMGIALAAAFGLLAMGAGVWYLKNLDWFSSIHRLQDML